MSQLLYTLVEGSCDCMYPVEAALISMSVYTFPNKSPMYKVLEQTRHATIASTPGDLTLQNMDVHGWWEVAEIRKVTRSTIRNSTTMTECSEY